MGLVVAPPELTVEAVELLCTRRSVFPGNTCTFCSLKVSDAYPSKSSQESDIAFRILLARLCVRASLHAPGSVLTPLQCRVVRHATANIVDVTVDIPLHAPEYSVVVIDAAELAGLPVLSVADLRPVVSRRMVAPATLPIEGDFGGGCVHTLSFGSDGTLFVPRFGSETVVRYSSGGASLAPIHQLDLGLSTCTVTALLNGSEKELLLLGGCPKESSVVAINIPELSVRWSTPVKHCLGLAPLAAHDVVVASSYYSECLHILRLSDGSEVNRVPIVGEPLYLASDMASGMVFASVRRAYDNVVAFEWRDGTLIEKQEVSTETNVVAVVPASRSSGIAHVLSARCGNSSIFVYSLPDLALVHTHHLEGVEIAGIAADASGTSIVVCDNSSNALLVLEWPLEAEAQVGPGPESL